MPYKVTRRDEAGHWRNLRGIGAREPGGQIHPDPGRIYLSGIQALVRLPLMQRARDRAAGLNTAGFISGYRGSPLGTYDSALWQAKALLEQNDIRFQPGLNEDSPPPRCGAASRSACFPAPRWMSVFGIW